MNWSDIVARLKDARSWALIISIVNLCLSAAGATPQVTQIANAAIGLIAFVLFGIEAGVVVAHRLRK